MRKALVFLASMVPVLMFGGYAINILRSHYASSPQALETALELATVQLFENPGDWNSTPPSVGLALEERGSNFTTIWPYVVDPQKLGNLSQMSYEDLRRSVVASGIDIRLAFFEYNATAGRFEDEPILTIGTPVLRESVLTSTLVIYLAGDVSLGTTNLPEGLYKVTITVSG